MGAAQQRGAGGARQKNAGHLYCCALHTCRSPGLHGLATLVQLGDGLARFWRVGLGVGLLGL
eukprot:7884885-Lingulodinium_polyedra.AAC.1